LSESETRTLAELKKDLEERIARSEREIGLLKVSLKLVDEALAKGSFKPASKLLERPEAEARPAETKPVQPKAIESPREFPEPLPRQTAPAPMAVPSFEPEATEQAFPIKSKMGDELGILYVGNGYLRIVPRPDLNFSAKTPPFQSFFIDRVIGEMHHKDEMAVDAGAKDPSSMIAHEVRTDGDCIKEIRVNNIDEEARIRELRSSIRWTLERMLEKSSRP
jgi:hypothetical protein